MPYVSPLSKSEVPAEAGPLLEAIEDKYGKALNTFGTMAHQPDVLKGVATVALADFTNRFNHGLGVELP